MRPPVAFIMARAAVFSVVPAISSTAAAQTVVVLPGTTLATDISADGRVVSGLSAPPGASAYDYFAWSQAAGLRNTGTGISEGTTFGAPFISGDGHSLYAFMGDSAGRATILSDTGAVTYIPSPSPLVPRVQTRGISHDGNAAIGYSFNQTQTLTASWRWTRTGGLQGLPITDVRAISGDGDTVVGSGLSDLALVWHNGTLSSLLPAPDSESSSTAGYRINNDGSIIVGRSGHHAARWINGQGILLPRPEGYLTAQASDVSDDGQVILGRAAVGGPDLQFIWTPTRGTEPLGAYFASQGINLTGYTIFNASVNANGTIFAVAVVPPGGTAAQSLLITVPAPAAGLGLPALCLLGRRRRRSR